jgi:hypothetical protein
MKFKSDVSVDGQITVSNEPTSNNHVATKFYVDSGASPANLPPGGDSGQVLTKDSAIDGDVSWQDASPAAGGSVDELQVVLISQAF